MNPSCNLGYKSSIGKLGLTRAITGLYYKLFSGNPDREAFIKLVYLILGRPNTMEGKVVQFNELSDEGAREFINDVTTILINIERRSPESFSDLAKEVQEIIMSTFFRQAEPQSLPAKLEKDINDAGVTDEAIKKLRELDLAEALNSVYKDGSVRLRTDLLESFNDELYKLLVYDDANIIIHNLNREDVNKRILRYKKKKFMSVLNFLKKKYPNDLKLNLIKGLYSFGFINGISYNYVIDLFLKFLDNEPNLSELLDLEVSDRANLVYLDKLTDAYKKLIRIIKGIPQLKTWFENKFTGQYRELAENLLFEMGEYSRYYNIVKTKLDNFKDENPSNPMISVIQNLEKQIRTSSSDGLLEVVDDYVKLVYFDDLLNVGLGDQVTYDSRKFQKNQQIANVNIPKYNIRESTKHQKQGWEGNDKEDAEQHTAATTKFIISRIPIYSYEFKKATGERMDFTKLVLAWQSLMLEIDELTINDLDASSEKRQEYVDKLKSLQNEFRSTSLLSAASDLLAYLFEQGGTNGGAKDLRKGVSLINYFKAPKYIRSHINTLYSFYSKILCKNNPFSVLSKELNQINQPKGSGIVDGAYLSISSNLAGVLSRNVSNTQLEIDLSRGSREIKIRQKFTWNSELFDLIEGCVFPSKIRQHTLLSSDTNLRDYNFQQNTSGDYKLSITLKVGEGEDIKKYNIGYTSIDTEFKMYSRTLGRTEINEEGKKVLETIDKIDLDLFRRKLVQNQQLSEDEKLLKEVLQFIDTYLKFGLLTQNGLSTLKAFKDNYNGIKKSIPEENSPYYLEHFIKLAMRTAEADQLAVNASERGLSMKQYLEQPDCPYYGIFSSNKEDNKYSSIFDIEGINLAYILPIDKSDKILEEFAKQRVIVSGRSTRSTSLNKQGATISNYTVSRLGSELGARFEKQRQLVAMDSMSPLETLIFVKNSKLLDLEPVNDGEITTLMGDVKAIRDLSTPELFLHSMLDKFYKAYIDTDKIIFLPTVYADKTQFLNYRTGLSGIFTNDEKNPLYDGKMAMRLYGTKEDFESILQKKYVDTFFTFHSRVGDRIIGKFRKLIKFDTGRDISGSLTNEIKIYLRGKTEEELLDVVSRYNKANPNDKIELESEKDYRKRYDGDNQYCDINEIVFHYKRLADPSMQEEVEQYFDLQKKIFLDNLKENGVTLKLFDTREEMNSWKEKNGDNEKSKERYDNYLLQILSSEKLLKTSDERKRFIKEWVNQDNGQLIFEKNGKLNPFLERFFYIEGLLSNNLRLSITGTEVNHPDKTSALIHRDKNLIAAVNAYVLHPKVDLTSDETNPYLLRLREVLSNLLGDEAKEYTDAQLDEFANNFKLYGKNISDLVNLDLISYKIYNKDIIDIINMAQGTQFKRNVIATATLQHPLLGLIDGTASEVLVSVIYDQSAPVNNLRESDTIDSQDGSARMSYIQYVLENNALGDQKVGLNRKPIWDDLTPEGTSFLAKFAVFVDTNSIMSTSAEATASAYNMFKKMHHIRWGGLAYVDLTHCIQDRNGISSFANQSDVNTWFTNTLCEKKPLYYKDSFGKVVRIVGFGKESGVYYTLETTESNIIKGVPPVKVYHYFNDDGEHFKQDSLTRPKDGFITAKNGEKLHTIDSLYELHKVLGGINSCDKEGAPSEFSLKVLTNFVINVGYKNEGVGQILREKDVTQTLKNKFIAYVFNASAVKNGAKNINQEKAWKDPSVPLNTFKLSTKGLGIQLNADHDVTDSELTEFSQVVAACAAYGKNFNTINEIYYGLAESAFEESKYELSAVDAFLKEVERNSKSDENKGKEGKAKYQLYKIVAKLILRSRSNSDYDVTEALKDEIRQTFKVEKDGMLSSDEIKIPFSDPSIYSRFITSITSVINLKSIKRKHPGSGYVMAPGYNLVQYYQVWDPEKLEYRKYMFEDILRKAREELRSDLIDSLKHINGGNTLKVGEQEYNFINYDLQQLVDLVKASGVDLNNPVIDETKPEQVRLQRRILNVGRVLSLTSDLNDVHKKNIILINNYLNRKLEQESLRSKEWFLPTDIVDVLKEVTDPQTNTTKILKIGEVSLDAMEDFYKFKDGISQIELTYNVKISRSKNDDGVLKYRISLPESGVKSKFKSTQEFVLEQTDLSKGSNIFNIHFRTGTAPGLNGRRGLSNDIRLSDEQLSRLFSAAIDLLPEGAELRLQDSTDEQIASKVGGLTKGSIAGFTSLDPTINPENEGAFAKMQSRVGNSILEKVVQEGDTRTLRYFIDNDNVQSIPYFVYRKVGVNRATSQYRYRLNVRRPVNLKPSLIRWKYIDDNNRERYMTIYDHPIIRDSWNLDKTKRPTQKEIQKVLDDLDNGIFYLPGNDKPYKIIEGSYENTEAEVVLGNMYKDLFGIDKETLAEIMDKGESFFFDKIQGKSAPIIPRGFYDLAFTKNNGDHVLISFGAVKSGYGIIEVPFDRQKEEIDKNTGEVHCDGIKVAKYVELTEDEKKNYRYDSSKKKVLNADDQEVDPSTYMLVDADSGETRVLKRIDFVKKYSLEKIENVGGIDQVKKYTLYKIADVNVIKNALDFIEYEEDKDGIKKKKGIKDKSSLTKEENNILYNQSFNQISNILYNIFKKDDYSDVVINTGVSRQLESSNESEYKVNLVKDREYITRSLGGSFTGLNKAETKRYLILELGMNLKEYEGEQKVKVSDEELQKKFKNLNSFLKHMLKVIGLLNNDVMTEDGKEVKIDFTSDYKKELNKYHELKQHYKKQWASFLTSLHFISSRIPAQSLQSFMPMICVGWTNDQSNTAYVSYIQTYLQGSDYDIDKAYIMGQSFTDNGEYIGWSNLFDYSSDETIIASKALPLPRGYKLVAHFDSKYDIDSLLSNVKLAKDEVNLALLEKALAIKIDNEVEKRKANRKYNRAKAKEIRAFAKLINKIDELEGRYNHAGKASRDYEDILRQVLEHENYSIPRQQRSSAYKNVASANIWTNVHNVRNRDQAYSPITMRDLKKLAAKSPKGQKTKALNMANPLTKYIMQNQNLVGKDVIAIAANGEKDWFNLTYYYHKILRTGDESDKFFIKMQHEYTRIHGRAAWALSAKTVKHIPDLWYADGTFDSGTADTLIALSIKNMFYSDKEFATLDLDDKYVDLMISQLLSAATDNAKELILARINSGINLAKYYLHMMIMGFKLDDIVSFMTSPVIELVDKYSKSNFYDRRTSKVDAAIKLISGEFKLEQFLHLPFNKRRKNSGPKDPEYYENIDQIEQNKAEIEQAKIDREIQKAELGLDESSNKSKVSGFAWVVSKLIAKRKDGKEYNIYYLYFDKSGESHNSGFNSLEEFVKYYIQSKIASKEEIDKDEKLRILVDYHFPKVSDYSKKDDIPDFNTIQFFEFVDGLVSDINEYVNDYRKTHPKVGYTLTDFKLDLEELKKLSREADETSTLASVWLKFNQGIPQTDVELIKRIKKMNDTVSTRERFFGINRIGDIEKRKSITLADEDEIIELENERVKDDKKGEVIDTIDWITSFINTLYISSPNLSDDDLLDTIISKIDKDDKDKTRKKKYIEIIRKIKAENKMLTFEEITSILVDAINAGLYGNFDVYSYLLDKQIILEDMRYKQYKDKRGKYISGKEVGYRELAARYYNLIKASWNILDIMRKIPHYEKNLDLFNYTVQTRLAFPNKAKIVDRLVGLAELSYENLSDNDYREITRYADKVLTVSYFFNIKHPIPLDIIMQDGKPEPKLYNSNYDLVPKTELSFKTLNGIDSLKHFVENEFLLWMKEKYKDNILVLDLNLRSNQGRSILRLRLNFDEIDNSLNNKQTFNDYLNGLKALNNETFAVIRNNDGSEYKTYTVADILALYNLAVNGTKLGGKYLTAIFRDFNTPGTALHDYYKYLGESDYNQIYDDIHPTKLDFLIFIAPTVSSEDYLKVMTEPYVKVKYPVKGYEYYKRTGPGKYDKVDLAEILGLESLVDDKVKDLRLFEFTTNSLTSFPELYRRMTLNDIFKNPTEANFEERLSRLNEDIRKGKITIIRDCS